MSATKIQVRRDVASNWTSENPVLNAGEFGLDLTSMKLKIGDGISVWNALEYIDDDGPKLSSGTVEPTGASHGDLFVNTSTCPPVLHVYSDPSQCPNDSGWNPIGVEGTIEELIITPTDVTPQPVNSPQLTATPIGLTVILPDSLITFTWYQYDDLTGGEGTELQTLTSGSAISDTYTPVGADMGKYIGCTVRYLGEVVTETTRATIGVADTPVATMKGLRFDEIRETQLTRHTSTATSDTLTVSFWAKPTASSSYHQIIVFSDNANGPLVGIANGSWNLYNVADHYTAGPVVLNEWSHVVLQVDQGDATLYVNGVQTGACTGFVPGTGLMVGDNVDGPVYTYEGYLSDVYLVENQILDPSTFAQEFTLGWGPIDSSQVKLNIGAAKPSSYDTRDNMTQTWSTLVTTPTGIGFVQPVTNMFDGNTSTVAQIDSSDLTQTGDNSFTVDLSSIGSFNGEIEVWASNASETEIYINGDENTKRTLITSQSDWQKVKWNAGTLTSLTLVRDNSGGLGCAGIKVDGRQLVDGPANNSVMWSDTCDTGGNTAPNEGKDLMFDGNTSTTCQALDSSGQTVYTFTFDPPIGNGSTDTVEIMWYRAGSVSFDPQVNGSAIQPTNGVYYNAGNQVSSVGLCHNQGSGANGIMAFRLNGEILIDGGRKFNLDKEWSADVQSMNGGTFRDDKPVTNSFDGDLDTFSEPPTNNPAGVGYNAQFKWVGTGFTPGTKAVVYVRTANGGGGNGSTDDVWTEVNGVRYIAEVPVTDIGYETTITAEGELTVEWKGAYSSGGSPGWNYVLLRGIQVGDSLLVDPASFGPNGYYLPFDPDAVGNTYSNACSITSTRLEDAYSRDFSGIFDGTLDIPTRYLLTAQNDLQPSNTFRWKLPETVTGRFRIYCRTAPELPGPLIKLYNNGVETTNDRISVTSAAWYDFGDQTFDEFEATMDNTQNNTEYAYEIYAFELDGQMFIDGKPIGVDDSGDNTNNFADKGFAALSNSTGNHRYWRLSIEKPVTLHSPKVAEYYFYMKDGTKFTFNAEGLRACDNSGTILGNEAAPNPSGQVDIDGEQSIVIDFGTNGAEVVDAGGYNTYNGAERSAIWRFYWSDDNSTWNLAGRGLATNTTLDGNSQRCGPFWIQSPEIAEFYYDTVVDNPILSYAIAESGISGNLITDGAIDTGRSTQPMVAGTGYYFESTIRNAAGNLTVGIAKSGVGYGYQSDGTNVNLADLVGGPSEALQGDVIGVVVENDTSTPYVTILKNGSFMMSGTANGANVSDTTLAAGSDNSTGFVNFGQQPFKYATNNGNGTATIQISSPDYSREWSLGTSSGGNSLKLFDGDLSGQGAFLGKPAVFTPSTGIPFTKSFEVFGGETNYDQCIVDVDGVSQPLVDLTNGEWTVAATGGGNITRIQVQDYRGDGYDGAIYGCKADGRILIDGPADIRDYLNNSTTSGSASPTEGESDWNNAFDGIRSIFKTPTACSSSGSYSVNFPNNINFGTISSASVTVGGAVGGSIEINDNYAQRAQLTGNGTQEIDLVAAFNGDEHIKKITLNPNGGSTTQLYYMEINGQILVQDNQGPGTGPWTLMTRTWTEQQSLALNFQINKLGNYEAALRAVAAAYINSGSFDTGAIVAHNGELWQALVDNAEATEPSEAESATWNRLNLSE